MLTPTEQDELSALISDAIDGQATPPGHARLEAMLQADADAVRYYVDYLALHRHLGTRGLRDLGVFQQDRLLADRLLAGCLDPKAPGAIRWDLEPDFTPSAALEHLFAVAEHNRRQRKRVRIYGWRRRDAGADDPQTQPWGTGRRTLAWASAAAIIVLAAAVTLLAWLQPTPPRPVARFTQGAGAQFAGPTVVREGDALSAGHLTLSRGVAQIDFRSGAHVVVEAPAEFDLLTADGMALTRGRLVAHVPGRAKGFSVRTPRAWVVDLGTEFAAWVDAAGRVDVHVFAGRVELRPMDGVVGPAGAPIQLQAGEARRLHRLPGRGGAQSATPLALGEQDFIRTLADAHRKRKVVGDWWLGIGGTPQPRITNPQSPTPNHLLVGDALIDRPMNDSAVGSIFVFARAFESAGRVSEWAFFDDDGNGRRITPLILKPAVGPWEVVGIGRTRTSDGSGAQRHTFDPVAGSDRVESGYAFGWKDGGVGADNAGVVDFQLHTSAGAIWHGAPRTNFAVGDRFSSVPINTPLRVYSIQATLESSVPSDPPRGATGP